MSSSKLHHFDSYLHRIHRRWIFWRVVESIGAGAVFACLFALILSFILFARGESSLTLTLLCLAIGIALGTIAGWLTRPSEYRTAAEIDRQFGLADLIATALAIRQSRTFIAHADDQPWSQTILNIADARSIELASQSLLLRRWGVRGWSGIGLSAALVLTFGLLSTNPLVSRANRPDANPRFDSQNANQNQITQPTPAFPREDQPESRQKSQVESTHTVADAGQSSGDTGNQHSNPADQSGHGEGTTVERPHRDEAVAGHSNAPTDDAGAAAIGGGNATYRGNGQATGNATASDQSPGQHSDHWPSNESLPRSQPADQRINPSSVPDAYRDLVRDYFQRN